MLFKVLHILDPIVFDGVRMRAEEIVAIFHSFGQDPVYFFVVGVVVNKVKHIDPVTSLANPLNSANPLLKPRRIPRQVYIDECPERLKIQTFAGCIRGHNKADSPITHGLLYVITLDAPPLSSEEKPRLSAS